MEISKNNYKNIILILFLGFVIRLVLMPITFHGDLFWINSWPSKWVFYGIFDAYEYMTQTYPDYFSSYGCFYYGPMTYLFVAFFQFIYKIFVPNMGEWMVAVDKATMVISSTVKPILLDFYTKDIFKYCFFMKLPYLFVDVSCLFILFKFCNTKKFLVSVLWAFNPVIIYATYMFGQIDLIIGFLVLLTVFCVYKEKKYLALFLLGLGTAFKTTPVVLILPSAILLADNKKDFIKLISFSFLGLFLPFVFFCVNSTVALGCLFPGVIKGKLVGHNQVDVSKMVKLILLGLGYFLVLFGCFKAKKNKRDVVDTLLYVYLAVFLLMYSLLSTAVHYFLWCIPLLFVLACKDKTKIKYVWILSFCILIYKVKRASMCFGLFAPLNPEFFYNLPGLNDLTLPIRWKNIVKIFRLIFIGSSFYLVYSFVRYKLFVNKEKI